MREWITKGLFPDYLFGTDNGWCMAWHIHTNGIAQIFPAKGAGDGTGGMIRFIKDGNMTQRQLGFGGNIADRRNHLKPELITVSSSQIQIAQGNMIPPYRVNRGRLMAMWASNAVQENIEILGSLSSCLNFEMEVSLEEMNKENFQGQSPTKTGNPTAR
jgi:hypothetical protein